MWSSAAHPHTRAACLAMGRASASARSPPSVTGDSCSPRGCAVRVCSASLHRHMGGGIMMALTAILTHRFYPCRSCVHWPGPIYGTTQLAFSRDREKSEKPCQSGMTERLLLPSASGQRQCTLASSTHTTLRLTVPVMHGLDMASWKSVANDDHVSDAVDENAAHCWTHRCGHTVGM